MSPAETAAPTMEKQKVYITGNNTVQIQCPDCAKSRSVPVSTLKKHLLKVRCSCGTLFGLELEFRRHFRREMRLDGVFRNLSQEAEEQGADVLVRYQGTKKGPGAANCTITNLSRGGLGFVTKAAHTIRTGQELQLEFALDNTVGTFIVKKALVRVVRDRYIGCQFTDADRPDATLGFYLL